jgi:hypothetical protein
MVAWMLERVTPADPIRERGYRWASYPWIRRFRRVPFSRRWALLRQALATDPHAVRRMIRFPLAVKLKREFRRAREFFESARRRTFSSAARLNHKGKE